MCFKFSKAKPTPMPAGLINHWPTAPSVSVYAPLGQVVGSWHPAILVLEVLSAARPKTDFAFRTLDNNSVTADIVVKFYHAPWTKTASFSETHPPEPEDNLGGVTILHARNGAIQFIALWMNTYPLADGPGYPQVFKNVFLHEWGHVMGLPHRNGPRDVMNIKTAWSNAPTWFSAEELAIINAAY